MARVVQRRSGPPYLLIAFVFLFLIATTLAVLMYVQKGDLAKINQSLITTKNKLASSDDLGRPEISAAMANNEATVIAQLTSQIAELSKYITGNIQASGREAIDAAKAIEKDAELGIKGGLVAEIRNIVEQKKALQVSFDNLKAELEKAAKDRDTALASVKSQQDEFDKKLAELKAQNESLSKSSSDYQAAQQAKLEEARKLQDEQIEKLNKQINMLNTTIGQATQKYQQLQSKYDQLLSEYRKETSPNVKPDTITIVPKGKVAEVMEDQKIVYINKGSKDKIMPGMTFAVYPTTGIPEDGKNKGTIVVTNVSNNISECRIVESNAMNPILVGELIGNVAYNPQRVYTFVVRGNFDLRGAGKATREGAQEVIDLIKRSGGKVDDELSIHTDFLVAGEEPSRPGKLDDTATPQDQAVFQAQLKEFEEYNHAKEVAPKLFVPIINSNKFVSLIGFSTPPKK